MTVPEDADIRADRAAPLAGVRIVAVEQYGAGPFGTLYLADLGAEIIKVETRHRRRRVALYPARPIGHRQPVLRGLQPRQAVHRARPGSRRRGAVFERLVASADAVYSNLRGDQPERLGLTYDAWGPQPGDRLRRLTGTGGPGRAPPPGYDALIQAESGWAALTGLPDGPPARAGCPWRTTSPG